MLLFRVLLVLAFCLASVLPGLTDPHPELVPQNGHAGFVDHVALSTKGISATGSVRELKVWSADGRVMGHFALHSELIGLGFSEDADSLVAVEEADAATLVRTWRLPGLSEGRSLRLQTGASQAVVRDGSVYLLTGQTVKKFSLPDGTAAGSFDAGADVSTFAVGPDSNVGALTEDGVVLWRGQNEKPSRLPWVGKSLAISSDGECLALTNGSEVKILSSAGTLLAERDFSKAVGGAGWISPNRLAVVVFNGPALVWDYRLDRLDQVAESTHWNHLAAVPGSFVTSYSDFVNSQGQAAVWKEQSGLVKLEGQGSPFSDVFYHAETQRLLALTFSQDLVVLDTLRGRMERVMDLGSGLRHSLTPTIKPNKKRALVAAFLHGSVSLWDFESGDRLFQLLPFVAEPPSHPVVLPDGTVLPVGSASRVSPPGAGKPPKPIELALEFHPRRDSLLVFSSGYLSEYSFAGELLGRQSTPHRAPVDAAVSPSGKKIAVCERFRLSSFDLETEEWTIALEGDGFAQVEFGTNDDTLAVRDLNGKVTLVEQGKTRMIELGKPVRSLAFSPDGKNLTLGDTKGKVSVVALQGSEVRTVEAHPGHVVNGLAYLGETMVSASNGGDIRFWSASDGLLASVYPFSGRDWLAVSPQGFFDGSSAGQRALDWKVGEKYYRVDQFFEDYFRPGLLALLLSGREPQAKVSSIAKLPTPPEIEILSPASGAPMPGAEVEVELKVVDTGGGISDVRLFHNGHRVRLESDQTRRVKLSLVSGVNEIRVSAFNSDHTVESRGDRIRLVCTVSEAGRPVLYQLVVGVDEYPGGQRLQYATTDAKAASAVLESELYSAIDSRVLLDGQATRSEILRHLKEIGAKAKPQDTLVLYFAGHGTVVGEAFLFMPHDGSFGASDGGAPTGIKWEEIAERLAEIPATRQLIVLDTCHAGAAVALSEAAIKWVKASHSLARDSGCYLVAAANSEQSALETGSLGHGLLTYAILEALGADQPAKAPQDEGVVTAGGLVYYISTAVPKLAKKHGAGHRQEVVQFSTGVDFPIAKPAER